MNNTNNIYDESEGNKLVEILDKSAVLELSKRKLQDWNESNTVKIKIDNEFKSLAEFQVHRSRDSMKCRFNFETILLLINKGIIKNIKLQEFDLKYKYMIKVLKEDNVDSKENNKEHKNYKNEVNKLDEFDEEYKESSKSKINIIKKKCGGVFRRYALRKYGRV
jgi:hypothetical protein